MEMGTSCSRSSVRRAVTMISLSSSITASPPAVLAAGVCDSSDGPTPRPAASAAPITNGCLCNSAFMALPPFPILFLHCEHLSVLWRDLHLQTVERIRDADLTRQPRRGLSMLRAIQQHIFVFGHWRQVLL